jgi:hypothetical protein
MPEKKFRKQSPYTGYNFQDTQEAGQKFRASSKLHICKNYRLFLCDIKIFTKVTMVISLPSSRIWLCVVWQEVGRFSPSSG